MPICITCNEYVVNPDKMIFGICNNCYGKYEKIYKILRVAFSYGNPSKNLICETKDGYSFIRRK